VALGNVLDALRAMACTMARCRFACDAQLLTSLRSLLLPLVADVQLRSVAVETLAALCALDGTGEAIARDLVGVVESTLAREASNANTKAGCAALLGALARAVGGLRARAFLPTSTSLLLRLVSEQRDAAVLANRASSAMPNDNVAVLYAALRALWLTIDVAGLAFAKE
jgi:hypothetical protein